jgi:alkylation response protein AidB-like acyl-CoA dehydrogenase
MYSDDVARRVRESARSFLSGWAPPSEGPGAADQPSSDARWKAIIELGWPGIEIPERYGGGGGCFAHVCALMEELGQFATDLPAWSTMAVAVRALTAASEQQQELWYPRMAAGEAIVAAAIDVPRGRGDGAGLRARPTAGGWLISGTARWVLNLPSANAVLLATLPATPTGAAAGQTLFLAPARLSGFTVVAENAADRSRQLGQLCCDDVLLTEEHQIGQPGRAAEMIAQLRNRAAVGLAADSVGGARRALEMTLAHLKTRRQFGRALGSFQALKHRCASTFIEIELASAAVDLAASLEMITDGAASIAKTQADDAFRQAAAENVQLHGAMGFTWEHPAHTYLRRALLNSALYGDPLWHRNELANLLVRSANTPDFPV